MNEKIKTWWDDPYCEPPERDSEPTCYCGACGEGIYKGDHYYAIEDEIYCGECIEQSRRTA